MDFFEQQERARRQTSKLVFYYILAVIGIIVSIYLVIHVAAFKEVGWNPAMFLWTAVITITVILLGSLYKMVQLAQGGSAVASMLGGRPISIQTANAAERRLLNVVDEMAIASGLASPEVYVLDHEQSINAFAAGKTPGDAVIGVSRGCIDKLSRDELQGVIGHEFSHILNGDMRLNIRLISLLAGILLIAMIGYWIMRLTSSSSSSSSRKDSNNAVIAIILFGLALLVIGFVGVFFAKLIKCAVSRQREFLADASSVQFTRNPAGIGGALRKIANDGSGIKASSAEEISHMFFCNGLTGFLSGMFSTHPSIPERLSAIEGVDVKSLQPVVAASGAKGAPRLQDDSDELAGSLSMLNSPQATARPMARLVNKPLKPFSAAAQFGALTPQHLDYASQVIASLPPLLKYSLKVPFSARAVLFAMLLSPDAEVRQKQMSLIETQTEPGTLQETRRLASEVSAIPIEFHVGIISLLIPALRQLTATSYETFRKTVNDLVVADGQIDIFEFTLQKMLFRHLDIYLQHLPPPIPNIKSLDSVTQEISILMSALAHCGSGDVEASRGAFERGITALRASEKPALLDGSVCGINQIDQALDKLVHLIPPLKKRVLDACFAIAASDGSITVWEGELLRAVADMLDCPLPPFVMSHPPSSTRQG